MNIRKEVGQMAISHNSSVHLDYFICQIKRKPKTDMTYFNNFISDAIKCLKNKETVYATRQEHVTAIEKKIGKCNVKFEDGYYIITK